MKLGVQGILTIVEHRLDRHLSVEEAEALARAGEDVRVRHVRNHIADTGLDAIAALVGGGYGSPMVGAHTYTPDTVAAIDAVSPSGAFIGEMRLGAITSPPEPTDADTGLAGPTAYSVRASLTEPRLLVSNTEDEVRFSCYLPAGFLAGHTITEEGIFTFDGDLFARVALDVPEVLGDAYGVQFIHRVRFATFLTLVPPPVLLGGTIDVNPDILGGLGSGRVIADIIDVAPDILGDLVVSSPPVAGTFAYTAGMQDPTHALDTTGSAHHGSVSPSTGPVIPVASGVVHPPVPTAMGWERTIIACPQFSTPTFNNIDITIDTDALVDTINSGKGLWYPFRTDDADESGAAFYMELNLIIVTGVVMEIEFIFKSDGPFPFWLGPIPVHGFAPGPFNDTFTFNLVNGAVTCTSANLGLLGVADGGAGAFYADWATVMANLGCDLVGVAHSTDDPGGPNMQRVVDFRGY